MMKNLIILVLFSLVLGGCSMIGGGNQDVAIDDSAPYVVVNDGENSQAFNVEVMRTDEELKKGLMFRDNLEPHRGMIFIFEKAQPLSFWMKNMRFPIDMVFMNSDLEVLNIAKEVPPCRKDPCTNYVSKGDGQVVLEINAGYADKYGFEEGDQVEFKNFDF